MNDSVLQCTITYSHKSTQTCKEMDGKNSMITHLPLFTTSSSDVGRTGVEVEVVVRLLTATVVVEGVAIARLEGVCTKRGAVVVGAVLTVVAVAVTPPSPPVTIISLRKAIINNNKHNTIRTKSTSYTKHFNAFRKQITLG